MITYSAISARAVVVVEDNEMTPMVPITSHLTEPADGASTPGECPLEWPSRAGSTPPTGTGAPEQSPSSSCPTPRRSRRKHLAPFAYARRGHVLDSDLAGHLQELVDGPAEPRFLLPVQPRRGRAGLWCRS